MNLQIPEDKIELEKFLFDDKFSEEEITKRQWQILNAATKIFAEKGFDGARTSEIAKEANVAEGTIFRYYKTKKDLLMGLVLPLIIKFFRPLILKSAGEIMKNEEDKPIEEVLENLLVDRLELAKSNFPLIKTVFIESAYQPELLKVLQDEIGPIVIPFINKFIEANIEKGNFKKMDSMLVTKMLMSLLVSQIVLTNTFPEFFKVENQENEIKKMIEIFLHGIKNSDCQE